MRGIALHGVVSNPALQRRVITPEAPAGVSTPLFVHFNQWSALTANVGIPTVPNTGGGVSNQLKKRTRSTP
jgi:hypothetical protein